MHDALAYETLTNVNLLIHEAQQGCRDATDERLPERIKNQRAALVLHTFIPGVPFSWEEPITPLTDAEMRELRAALVDKGFCP